MRRRLGLALLLAISSGFCSRGQSQGGRDIHRYVNCDFGYFVRVPDGLSGKVPEWPRHGFSIEIPSLRSIIRVTNEYNIIEGASVEAIAREELRIAKEGTEHWHVDEFSVKEAKRLPSVQAKATYRKSGTSWSDLFLIMYRAPEAAIGGNIVYVIRLSAPTSFYRDVVGKFEQTVEGFQLTPIPHGPCANE